MLSGVTELDFLIGVSISSSSSIPYIRFRYLFVIDPPLFSQIFPKIRELMRKPFNFNLSSYPRTVSRWVKGIGPGFLVIQG